MAREPATRGVVGSVGSMTTGVDPAALLHRHVPVLRYDSQEPYFADAASEWTDNPGNQLRRADGTVIAVASADSGQAHGFDARLLTFRVCRAAHRDRPGRL
jgi:hypothetical protein